MAKGGKGEEVAERTTSKGDNEIEPEIAIYFVDYCVSHIGEGSCQIVCGMPILIELIT
jgi:hypothetical protein